MTKIEALGALLDMAERKVAIYDGIKDRKQKSLLKYQITALVWALEDKKTFVGTPEMFARQRALERRFPL